MARAIAGDADAFGTLYARHRAMVFARCRAILVDEASAEDAVHEGFLRALTHIRSFDVSKPLGPWLSVIAANVSIDHLRRAKIKDACETLEVCRDGRDSTFEAVVDRELWRRVSHAAWRLPARQRRALFRSALDGESYEHIAAAEGVTVDAVKSMLGRARVSLKKACEGLVSGIVAALLIHIRRPTKRSTSRRRTWIPMRGEERLQPKAKAFFARLSRPFSPAADAGLARIAEPLATAILSLAVAILGSTTGQGPPRHFSQSMDGQRPQADAQLVRERSGPPLTSLAHTARRTNARAGGVVTNEPLPSPPWQAELMSVTSFAVSPNYEQDHTIFASGSARASVRLDAALAKHPHDLRFPLYGSPALFVSRDGAATWSPLPAVGMTGQQLLLPPAYPVDPRIFAMGNYGLQESTDGGDRFKTVSFLSGFAAISPAFNAGDPRILIASSKTYQYSDETRQTTPARYPGGEDVWFSPDYPRHPIIMFGGYPPRRCDGYRCIESRVSDDYGSLDTRVSPGFSHDGVALAFNRDALFLSEDGGRRFRPIIVPTDYWPFGWIHDAALARGGNASSPVILAAIEFPQLAGISLWRSDDIGQTWRQHYVEPLGYISRIAVTPTGRIVVAGKSGGVACSSDGGGSWATACTPE